MTTSAQFPSGPGNPVTGIANVQTTNYQVLATDGGTWIVVNSSGAINVTLPATPPSAQFSVGVISIGTGTTTVLRNGNNINGVAANLSLSQNEGTLFATDGTNWFGIEPTANGVTSVGLTMPAIFTVTGTNPITSSGTFTVTLQAQTGNVVLASPAGGGSGTPTFRSLVAADIPNLDASKITTGALALARGGTNADLSSAGGAHTFLAEDASHVVTARTIAVADQPSVGEVTVTGKTANYLATAGDIGTCFIFNSATPVTLTLPAAAPAIPWWIQAINIGAGLLTINPNGLNLNGAGANTSLKTGQGTKIVTDAANYFCAFQALSARTVTALTTGSLINNAIESGVALLSKTILVVQVQTSVNARVRLYSTTAARNADVGRSINTPVATGTQNEVIMDVVLNGVTGLVWIMSPAAWGSDGKVTPDGNIAYNITNMSGGTTTVTVTWTYIALE